MEDKPRVAFWFGRDSEVRYVATPPELGDFVSQGSELWLVSDVVQDDLGLSVLCEKPPDPELQRHLRDART
jgi:hypothetical protein